MPEQPTWDQIAEFAATLNDPDNDVYGVILKGIAQYGQLAPFMSYTYAHGLRWFDEDWQPQFTTPEWKEAAQKYVDLVQTYGEPGASSVGFVEGLGLMSQGQGAIWVDATVAAGLLGRPGELHRGRFHGVRHGSGAGLREGPLAVQLEPGDFCRVPASCGGRTVHPVGDEQGLHRTRR